MNKEEIQKLIGGYATGSLTDDERRQLFEAALDDQELFDALQGEQALKELLDDPISRQQVRLAAAESLPHTTASPKASWFRRPWIWAAGASVAAAAVLLVVLVQWNPDRAEVKQVAVLRKEAPAPPPRAETSVTGTGTNEPPVKAAQPAGRPMAAKKEERRAAPLTPAGPLPSATPTAVPVAAQAPPPAPSEPAKSAEKDVVLAPPPAARVQTLGQQEQVIVTQAAPQAQNKSGRAGEMQRPAQAFRSRSIASTGAGLAPQLAVRDTGSHSFAKRLEDGSYVNVPPGTVFHPGETIRLTIVSRVSGPLVISEWDAITSSWNRLFPPESETIPVRALEGYTVPIDIVLKSGERLRVTVGSGAFEIPVEVR